MVSMVTIQLSYRDAERFKLFMKHYEVIDELISHNVFEIKNGHATLFFNHISKLMQIELSTKWRSRTKNLTEARDTV